MEDKNKQILNWVAKQETVDNSSVEVPVETPSEVTEVTEEQVTPVVVEAPKEQPEKQAEEPKAEVVTPAEELKPTSWDDEETPVIEKVETTKFDFKKIGSALDLKDVDSEDQIVTKVSELKTKLKELEENPLKAVSEEFREVLEVAKNGEDWRSFLAEQLVDYTKIDALKLFEDEFLADAVKNPVYFTEGKFDMQKAEDALDALPNPYKSNEGKKIQQFYTQQQQLKKQQIVAQAEAKRTKAVETLSKASADLNKILPVEDFGIKFEPKHSAQIYEGITNSNLTNKHFGTSFENLVKDGADMSKVTRTIALAEYGEKMLKYKSQAAKVEAKKEILDKTQNVQLKPSTTVASPEQKEKTAVELTKEYFERIRKGF